MPAGRPIAKQGPPVGDIEPTSASLDPALTKEPPSGMSLQYSAEVEVVDYAQHGNSEHNSRAIRAAVVAAVVAAMLGAGLVLLILL